MKKYFFLILLNLLISNKQNNAQCEIQTLITQLNSESVVDRLDAVRDLVNCDNPEAIPALADRFDIELNTTVKNELLVALDYFNYENIVSVSNQYLNNIDNYKHYNNLNKHINKHYIVITQFKYGDYSNADILFEYLNSTNNISDESVKALDVIIENVPALELQAKGALINTARNADHLSPRSIAIDILSKQYGLEFRDLLWERFTMDEKFVPRFTALKNMFKLDYPDLHSLLVDRLLINMDEFAEIRYSIADSLLKKWGEPWDLKDVIEYSQNEPEELYAELISYEVEDFIPPQPDDTFPLDQMVDNLIVYVDALLNYEWILPSASYDFYNQVREVSNSYYEQNFPVTTELLLEIIANALTNEEITTEDYKFLYYYSSYIKQRLEEL